MYMQCEDVILCIYYMHCSSFTQDPITAARTGPTGTAGSAGTLYSYSHAS